MLVLNYSQLITLSFSIIWLEFKIGCILKESSVSLNVPFYNADGYDEYNGYIFFKFLDCDAMSVDSLNIYWFIY